MEKASPQAPPAASQENKNPVIKDIDAKMTYGHKQLGSLRRRARERRQSGGFGRGEKEREKAHRWEKGRGCTERDFGVGSGR